MLDEIFQANKKIRSRYFSSSFKNLFVVRICLRIYDLRVFCYAVIINDISIHALLAECDGKSNQNPIRLAVSIIILKFKHNYQHLNSRITIFAYFFCFDQLLLSFFLMQSMRSGMSPDGCPSQNLPEDKSLFYTEIHL